MTDEDRADRLDESFLLARSGEPDAFAEWMGMVEIPLRRSLRRFARAVDVEVVVQETFVRMWLVANDPQRILEGRDASLKFAFRVARNVALEEIRRCRLDRFVDLGHAGRPAGRQLSIPNPAIPPWPGRLLTASDACLLSPEARWRPAWKAIACRTVCLRKVCG